GIDDRMDRRGDVVVAIEGDGRRLLQFEARGGQAPTPIDLDITGVQRLAIVVDFGENQDVADHLNLCEAKLMR
ncbi:MAG: NPCBM/NEW2 domain-containing protein, partial [Pirellulales bacterium]|nr:NPCBM/NEW2 domain-containing protein [Pirellulales bacterium]